MRSPTRVFVGMAAAPIAPGSFASSTHPQPTCWKTSRPARATSASSSSPYRRIGSGPASPCHGRAPKSASRSLRTKAGSTSANDHPSFPAIAHPS